jgi:hypothetical protein
MKIPIMIFKSQYLYFFLFHYSIFLGIETNAQTFNPYADAYVRNGTYAGTNYGTNASLSIKTSSVTGNSRNSFLMFDLTGKGINTVTSVKLRVYANTVATFTVGAYQVASTWTEAGLTWNNAPTFGSLISSVKISTKNLYYEWDLTSYVQAQLNLGVYKFSVALKDVASSGNEIIFNSKESSTNKPQIVVVAPIIPNAPTSLIASPISGSLINLSWTDNATNETGFKIERKLTGGSFVQVASVGANINSYSNTGLSPLTSYTYRILAFSSTGNSGYSNESTASTFDVLPLAPSGLSAIAASNSQINLNWTDNATNESAYTIECKINADTFLQIANLPANSVTFSHTGLNELNSYSYRVRALNSIGYSTYSNQVTATPSTSLPSTPSSLSAVVQSANQINLAWQDNATNESGYKIEQKKSQGNYVVIATLGSNVTSYSVIGLTSLTAYSYRIVAFNSAGLSNYSNEILTTTFADYYIDGIGGLDGNAGNTPDFAWKNISKLNTLTLGPGKKVLLKAGSTWNGQQLKFSGSGNATSPIVFDKYGIGAKPLLNGNGITGQGVVYLYNQQYIEINNMEITNSPIGALNSDFFIGLYNASVSPNPNPLGADRRGVMVAIDNFGTANHIYLKNIDIHHIKGQLGSGETSLNGAIPKRTGGIFFTVLGSTETTSANSRFDDVLIDSCNIYYCENIGIALDNEWNVYYPGGQYSSLSVDVTEYNNWFARRNSNLKISNNNIHHIGKNAMIIRMADETGLIQRNVCYETALGTTGNTMFTARCKGTVFQYNEGYLNRATTQTVNPGAIDGSMYDADYGSVGVVFQYSYSHDNSEGLFWGCNTRGSANNTTGVPDPGDKGCTVRYNVSQNDKGDLIFFNYPSAGNEIYNNTFYIGAALSPNIIHESSKEHTYNFFNNIIYNLSTTADYSLKDVGQTRYISNNLFYGNHPIGSLTGEPADSFKITKDPLLVAPGTSTIGFSSLSGYKLTAASPAINMGKNILANGGQDLWGNLLYQGLPDIGAHEFSNSMLHKISVPIDSYLIPKVFDCTIFPNPMANSNIGHVYLNTSACVSKISLLTLEGRMVYDQIRYNTVDANRIDFNFPIRVLRGLYLIRIESDKGFCSKKILIQ